MITTHHGAIAILTLLTICGHAQELTQRYVVERHGNLHCKARWAPAAGIRFAFAGAAGQQRIKVELSKTSARAEFVPGRQTPGRRMVSAQFHADAFPDDKRSQTNVVIKFRPTSWTIYLDQAQVAVLPAGLPLPVMVLQAKADLPDPGNEAVRFQKIGNQRFKADFMIEQGSPNPLGGMEAQSGIWRVHTVLDDAREQNSSDRLDRLPLHPEMSANFYSLKGREGIVTHGHTFNDNYSLSAALRIAPGEMGLVFYYRSLSDHYAFTLRVPDDPHGLSDLRLWRVNGPLVPRVIALQPVRLFRDQWVKPMVQISDNRVQCFLDNVKVIDVEERLPIGGKYGLYVKGDEEIIFDDLEMKSVSDLDLRSPSKIKFHTHSEQGRFFDDLATETVKSGSDVARLHPPSSSEAQTLIIGSPTDRPHVFAADFIPEAAGGGFGLICGYPGPSGPHIRFRYEIAGGAEAFFLEQVLDDDIHVLDNWRRASPLAGAGALDTPLTLMADSTTAGELRCYRNGELVLLHRPERAMTGASGVYIGPGTKTAVFNLAYRSEREGLYRTRSEKNRSFTSDPFMRHWSSPEGDWVHVAPQDAWHKSDFFRRFILTLPIIEGSTVHLGVQEGAADSTCRLRVAKGAIHLLRPPGDTAAGGSLASGRLGGDPADAGTAARPRQYSIHYEDYFVWVTAGKKTIIKHRLAEPLIGRRVRIQGFTSSQLVASEVIRYNVKDYLFTEAPCDWIPNGGRWQVINRFQCDPRWSHMNGESGDGIAAMWTKYRYRGDFCVELYAGIREGWYARSGDINLTVMAAETTPSQGYTVTCTGWDVDHSQIWTRLFRDGEIWDRSDKYLVPRSREGSVRRMLPDKIAQGRPVHGAWYYIKLRRVGRKLEYYFDNQLVFSREDKDLRDDGLLGIWTFLNSMVVARVKIGAERIEPLAAPLPPAEAAERQEPQASAHRFREFRLLRSNGAPLATVLPEFWSVRDTTGYARLGWHPDESGAPYLVLTNTRGGGSMTVNAHLPPVNCSELAGWRFHAQRTARAHFNFHYSIGRIEPSGRYVAERHFFHQISGTSFSRSRHHMTGKTTVPPSDFKAQDWHVTGDWQVVDVWLPWLELEEIGDPADLHACIEGFGNRQPSDVLQGLSGNGPGEAYAVKDLVNVSYAKPRLDESGHHDGAAAYEIRRTMEDAVLIGTAKIAEINDWISGNAESGLQTFSLLRRPAAGSPVSVNLVWIELPQLPNVNCGWDDELPDTIRLTCRANYPDRRFLNATVSIDDIELAAVDIRMNQMRFLLPRSQNPPARSDDIVSVAVVVGDEKRTYPMNTGDLSIKAPPVLMSLTEITPFFENFETHGFGRFIAAVPHRMRLDHYDSRQGCCLEVFNRGPGQRLTTTFAGPPDLARFPIFQFRYRADEMTNLSLFLNEMSRGRISEKRAGAKSIRLADKIVRDRTWQTWIGLATDAVAEAPMALDPFRPAQIRLGSIYRVDQTGIYSRWHIDDMIMGPAVSTMEQLALTPYYFDTGGVKTVQLAVCQGPTPFHSLPPERRQDLPWKNIQNGQRVIPEIGSRRNGFYHIFLRAVDNQDQMSGVTDIPFLYDTMPMNVTWRIVKDDYPVGNGTMVSFLFRSMGGAAVDLHGLRIKAHGREYDIGRTGSRLIHRWNDDQLLLNWPYIFRRELNEMKNDDVLNFQVRNIQDGAGNISPDLDIRIPIKHQSDKSGPAFLPVEFGDNIYWRSAWEGRDVRPLYFTPAAENETQIVHKPDEEPYLETKTARTGGTGAITLLTRDWQISRHPYFSFRICRPRLSKKVHLALALEFTDGGVLNISLNEAATGPDTIALPRPIAWETGGWHSITINLPDLLNRARADGKTTGRTVRSVSFIRSKGGTRWPLQLQSIYIHSGWRATDKVVIDAYDVSGIAGVQWEFVAPDGTNMRRGEADGMTIVPASLGIPEAPGGWLLIRVKDNSANIGVPLRIPFRPL